MEKDKNKFEDDDESLDDSKDKKSKASKKDSDEKKTKKNEPTEDESTTEESKEGELASFFKKKEVDDSDNTNEEALDDEEPNLTEEEVHEATLVIVDARQQEVSEELNQVEPESVDEFVALANAVFLEELEESAERNDNITEETIDSAYDEAVNDLAGDNNQDLAISDTNYDDTESSPVISNGTTYSGNNYLNNNLQSASNPNNASFGVVQNTNMPKNTETIVRTETIVEGRRSDMLVGAVIGYIIGRRGGRKRTEKKLQPKITNLEKQISELHYVIIDKEEKIRNLARQKAEEFERKKREEKENSDSGSNFENSISDEIVAKRLLKKKVKEQLKRRQELSEDPSVEKIGKFSLPALKVFHERRLPDGSENNPSRKQVEVMNESELLEKIDNLFIDGYKVASVYHKGDLKIEGLRQITKEYLRGGPFKETFYREMLKTKHDTESNKERSTSSGTEPSKSQNSGTKTSNISLGVLSEEEALKQAEALLLTHTDTKTKTNSSRVNIVVYTILFLIASIFILLLLT